MSPHAVLVDLAELEKITDQIKGLKEREKTLREKIANEFVNIPESTNVHVLPDQSTVKIKIPLNRTVDQDALLALVAANPQWRASDAFGELFTLKYSMSDAAYKKINNKYRAFIADVVTEKPGLPTIEWVRK